MPKSSNPVVVVTGAAGNLGVAVANTFLEQKARVVLVDRSTDRLARLFPSLVGSSDHILANSIDITDAAAVQRTVDLVHESLGGIDTLVNTAGGFRAGKRLEELTDEDWHFLFDLNSRSVFNTCRAVIPVMRSQGSGRIISVASRAALQGDAGASIYSASKSAVVSLTESMAAELQESGITANCVLPGLIDTPANRSAMPNADFSRWVSPESIAGVIAFLASNAARDITGASIPIYGRS
jgi:NAD(P)-dependent dehydrogenase (short-subunit alcohol dehydrogenase family)